MAEGLDVQECVTLQTDVRGVCHPADGECVNLQTDVRGVCHPADGECVNLQTDVLQTNIS